MKIIYAKKSSGIDELGSFQNPEYYAKPDQTATKVIIYGNYPHIEADYEELGVDLEVRESSGATPLIIGVNVGITPELQATLDDAKAESEKVVEENTALKAQIEALSANESAKSELESENSRLKDSVMYFENVQKESLEQLQAAKGNFIAFQNNIEAMKARIAELEQISQPTETEQPADSTPVAEKPKATKAK